MSFTSVEVSRGTISIRSNPKADWTVLAHVENFCGKSLAVFRVGQICERSLKLFSLHFGKANQNVRNFCEPLAQKFQTAWSSTSMLRIPETAIKALGSVSLMQAGEASARKVVQAFHDVGEFIAMACYTGLFVTGNALLKLGGDIHSFVADLTDLVLCSQDLIETDSLVKQVGMQENTAEIQAALEHSRTNILIKTAKAVCSVAGGAMGLFLVATGVALAPLATMLTISLAATSLATVAYFHNEARAEIVQFNFSAKVLN